MMKYRIKSSTKNPVIEYNNPANRILLAVKIISSKDMISNTLSLLDPIVNMV